MGKETETTIGNKLYQTLKNWFVRDFKPEDQLPTEHEIMEKFQVGRGTVRSSLNELVREGIIERSAGKGTFLTSDFLIRLKNCKVGILLSNREFSGSDTWEYTWHNHMEMLNGVMKNALDMNISLEMIPEGAVNPDLNKDFDGFISFRCIEPERLALLEKPVIPLHYELDLAGGLRGIVNHLVSRGFHRPAYIGTTQKNRVSLINQSLIDRGYPEIGQENIAECNGTIQDGYDACSRLLDGNIDADVLICSTDLRALGALSCLEDRGISVPDEMAVAGFDGIREAAYCHPGLTTWSFPWQHLGEIALQEIRSVLDGLPPRTYQPLSGQLIPRDSTSAKRVTPAADADQKTLSEYLRNIENRDCLNSALEELYKWCFRSGYLTREKLESNDRFTLYDMDRDINLVYQINYARARYQAVKAPDAPGASCLICRENAGARGKENLRVYDIPLENGRNYFAQLTPFPLSPRHFVLINRIHTPMDIGREALEDGLLLLKKMPGYTICSNSDRAWAGASILSHSHFQVFKDHRLPLMDASPLKGVLHRERGITGEMLNFPMPVLCLTGQCREDLVNKGTRIIRNWKDKCPEKNTFNLLFWKNGENYKMALILRNSDHRNPENRNNIKSEGIGVVEAAGEWIFPPPKDPETAKELKENTREVLRDFYKGISPFDMSLEGEAERILTMLWEDNK